MKIVLNDIGKRCFEYEGNVQGRRSGYESRGDGLLCKPNLFQLGGLGAL